MNNNQYYGGQNTQQPINNGYPQQGYQQPMYNQPINNGYDSNINNTQPEKKGKGKLVLIIVLALLFIGAIIAILFLTGVLGGKDKNESSNSNSKSNSDINVNLGIEPSKLYGIFSYKDSNQNSRIIVSQDGNISLSQNFNNGIYKMILLGGSYGIKPELDNSIKLKYNYSKSGYSAYNLYKVEIVTITESVTKNGKMESAKSNEHENVILGLGLSEDGDKLHLFMSYDKTNSDFELFACRGVC